MLDGVEQPGTRTLTLLVVADPRRDVETGAAIAKKAPLEIEQRFAGQAEEEASVVLPDSDANGAKWLVPLCRRHLAHPFAGLAHQLAGAIDLW